MADRSVRVFLQAVTNQYTAGMSRATASTAALSKQVGTFAKTNQNANAALNRFGLDTKTVMGGAVAGSLIYATNRAIEFESSFAGVRKTVSGTDAELDEIAQGLRDMAKEIPVNVNELNRIAESAGQLGIQRPAILGFTRTVAKLGVTTNLAGEQGAVAMARLGNIMQTSQGDFDRMGSTIVALGNAGASTESEIAEMGLRIAGAGAQINLSEGDVLGYANALSSVGVEAEAGGSAISRTFINIAEAVETGGEGLEDFATVAGMSAEQFQTAFRDDAAGATATFIEGLGGIKKAGGDVFGTLKQLGITEIRQRDALLRAAGAGDVLRDSLELGNQAWKENNALNAEAAKRFETTESEVQLLKNAVDDAAISIGQQLTVAIDGAAGPTADLVANLGSLSAELDLLGTGTAKAEGFMGRLGDAARSAIGNIVPGIGAVQRLGTAQDVAASLTNDAAKALEDYKDPLMQAAEGQADAAKATETHTGSITEQTEALYDLRTAQLQAAGGFLGVQGAAQALADSQEELSTAQAKVTRLMEKGKRGTPAYRDALQDLRAAEVDVIESQMGLTEAVNGFIEDVAKGESTQREAIDLVRAYGKMAGLSKEDVRDLVNDVRSLIAENKKLPTEKRTHYAAPGLEEELTKVRSLRSILENLDPEYRTTIVTQYKRTGGFQHPAPVEHAGGVAGQTSGAVRVSGGMRSDEVPAILQRGEIVLSRAEARNPRGKVINISIPIHADSMTDAQRLSRFVRREVEGVLDKHDRHDSPRMTA